MLIDRRNAATHLPWLCGTLAATLLALAWYLATLWKEGTWPTGSSPVGFTCGVAAALIVLFECLLWVRKKVRAARLGRMFLWMQAHVWLGLLVLPLALLHSGFYLGGLLSTLLMTIFLVVVASGVWGLVVQQWLPRQMLELAPGETIHSQVDQVIGSMVADARLLVDAASTRSAEERSAATTSTASASAVAVAATGGSKVREKVLEVDLPDEAIPGSEHLQRFFREQFEPFMRGGRRSSSPLRSPASASPYLDQLRANVDPAGHDIIDALARLCQQRRDIDLQLRLHFWLHNWLLVHVPLSALLLALLVVHAVAGLKYW